MILLISKISAERRVVAIISSGNSGNAGGGWKQQLDVVTNEHYQVHRKYSNFSKQWRFVISMGMLKTYQ